MKKRRVLFLCAGNSARSQMAEGLLKWHAGYRFDVHSARKRPRQIHPMAITVMDELGIDIRSQKTNGLDDLTDLAPFLFVIIVCAHTEAECPPAFSKATVILEWPFEDPANERIPEHLVIHKFRRVRDQINDTMLQWLKTDVPADWLLRKPGRPLKKSDSAQEETPN